MTPEPTEHETLLKERSAIHNARMEGRISRDEAEIAMEQIEARMQEIEEEENEKE